MPKKTLAAIAAENGLTIHQIKAAQANGVEVRVPEKLAQWMATRRPRAKATPPPAKSGAHIPSDPEVTIDDLVSALKAAQGYSEAKTIQAKITGIRDAMKARKEAGELIALSEASDAFRSVGAAVRAGLMRLEAELPPTLEGMSPPQMQKAIRDKVDEILGQLNDAGSKLWKA